MTVTTTSPRRITGLSKGKVRREMFRGEEHIVVPVVAMVGDSVIWPSNSPGPEYVPSSAIKSNAFSWNNRPIISSHPDNGSTANSPRFLDSEQWGTIFNSKWYNNCLEMEAWLSPSKAKEVSDDAFETLTKCANGETVEVSIGVSALVENRRGVTSKGETYTAIWHAVDSDHLAIGLNGKEGACSVEYGCGTNRSLSARFLAANGERMTVKKSVKQKLLSALDEMYDEDRRKLLNDALSAAGVAGEGKAFWVRAFSNKSVVYVVYSTKDDGSGNELYERDYTISDDGKNVSLSSTATIVEHKETFVPKGAERSKLRTIVDKVLKSLSLSPDAEEQTELIQYNTLNTLLSQVSVNIDQMISLVSELIADESLEATGEDELAEEAIEYVRLQSIQTLSMTAVSTLYSVSSSVYDMMREKELSESESEGDIQNVRIVDDTRYNAGARHSKSDSELIQKVHDQSVSLGAMCQESKGLSSDNGNQCQCKDKENKVKKEELVTKLLGCAGSPFKEVDKPSLLTMSEEALNGLVTKFDLQPTQTTEVKKEEPVTADRWLESIPTEYRSVFQKHLEGETEQRNGLIRSLVKSQTAFDEEALKSMTLSELNNISKVLQADRSVVDYSAMGSVARRSVSNGEREVPKSWDIAFDTTKAS